MIADAKKNRKRKTTDKNDIASKKLNTTTTAEDGEQTSIGSAKIDNPSNEEPNIEMNTSLIEPTEQVEQIEEEFITKKSFHMKKFRENLREGSDFIQDLRHFLLTAEDNPKIIGQYLKVGGKPLELVQSIEKIDKQQYFHIAYIFNALQLTLIEILSSEMTQLNQPAIQACSYLINSHRNCIERLLNSSNENHRRSVIKLLTAIVTLEPQFGRDILATINSVFNAENLQTFTKHVRKNSTKNNNDESDGDGEANDEPFRQYENDQQNESIRTCYIHFILAYLIEGNGMLIRNLLDRNELVMAVLSGLVYDSADTVCLVLGTLQRFVLNSAQVSKTKKVQAFHIGVIKHLVQLYDWKGPQYFQVMLQKKLKDKADQYVNTDDKSRVAHSVNEFLKILLTSRKYGIAFQCLGFRRTKSNTIQKRVLNDLPRPPWSNPLITELTIKILQSCPELVRGYIKLIARSLNPNLKSSNWFEAIEYYTKLIDELKPQIIRAGMSNMNVTETVHIIKGICLTPEILQEISHKNVVQNQNIEIRYKSTNLLYHMFRSCSLYLAELSKSSVHSENEMRKIKFDLINHIFVMCPPVQMILLSLHQTFQFDMENQIMLTHLEVVLDLLLIITRVVPSFIEHTASVINHIKIMRPIYELKRAEAMEKSELNTADGSRSIRIELKAVHLMLALEPTTLSIQTEYFQQVIQSVLNVFLLGNCENDLRDSHRLLRQVFENTGLFENGLLEIDLWLEALRMTAATGENESAREIIQDFLVKCLCNFNQEENDEDKDDNDGGGGSRAAIDDGSNYTTTHLNDLFKNIENGVSSTGIIDLPNLGRFYQHLIGEFKKLDPEEDNSNEFLFIETISLLLFHYLPVPNQIYELLSGEMGNTASKNHSRYMKSWLIKSKPGKLLNESSETGELFKLLTKFYDSLIDSKSNDDFLTIFIQKNSGFKIQLNNNLATGGDDDLVEITTVLADETKCMIFIYFTMFILENQHKNNQFNDKQYGKITEYLKMLLKILKELNERQEKTIESGFEIEKNEILNNPLTKALKYIFCSRFYLLNNFSFKQDENITNIIGITQFIYDMSVYVTELTTDQIILSTIFHHYQTKLINQFDWICLSMLNDEKSTININSMLKLLPIFQLNYEHCLSLINSICRLTIKQFINDSMYLDVLTCLLNRVSEIKSKTLTEGCIKFIGDIYYQIINGNLTQFDNSIEQFEDSLMNYLQQFSDDIPVVSTSIFPVIFTARRMSKSTIKLATILLERDDMLLPIFWDQFQKNYQRKELVYPLLNIACRKPITSFPAEQIITQIYGEFKNGIFKSIEKPQKAGQIYKENLFSSLFLLDRCMPQNECLDFSKRSTIKFDSADSFQLQMIKAIHLKALKAAADGTTEQKSQIFLNFLTNSIILMVILLRQEQLDWRKIEQFAQIITDWFRHDKSIQPNNVDGYVELTKSQHWQQFCKLSLKYGLRYENLVKNDQNTDIIVDNQKNAILLKLLAYLCDKFYPLAQTNDDCDHLFDMTICHSDFFDITLQQKPNELKTNLMYLLWVLITKTTKSLLPNQIPIFLAAYQAKLSKCDRFILAILQKYESSGVDLHAYEPFIWGESAISHYSIRNTGDNDSGVPKIAKTLQYQESPMIQALNLIDHETADRTISQFPIWRKLNAMLQVPEMEFKCIGIPGNEYQDQPSISQTRLEQFNETNQFDLDLLTIYSQKEEILNEIYDPAFFIPFMSSAFAPESFTRVVRPAQNGLLAITFAGLSSQDKQMRLATGNALHRYRQHLNGTRLQIWFHLFDCIERGLRDLTIEQRKHKSKKIPRIPFPAGLFLARTINTMFTPLNEMYRPLSNFLLFQKSFNFQTMPEFNIFFNGSDPNHQIHRQFMLETLRDGLKCGSDFTILMESQIMKALFGFYASPPIATRETNLLILTVINSAVKIPISAKVMYETVGIIPWLSEVIDNVDFFQFDHLDGICSVLNNLWHSIRYNQRLTPHLYKDFNWDLLNLLIKLCMELSSRIEKISFMKYLSMLEFCTVSMTVSSVALSNQEICMINKSNLMHLIGCARGLCKGSDIICFIDDLIILMECNVNYVEQNANYVARLRRSKLIDENDIFICSTLRKVIVKWRKFVS